MELFSPIIDLTAELAKLARTLMDTSATEESHPLGSLLPFSHPWRRWHFLVPARWTHYIHGTACTQNATSKSRD